MRTVACPLVLVALLSCGTEEALEVKFLNGATKETIVLADRFTPRCVQQPDGKVRVTYRAAGRDNRQLEMAFTAAEAGGGVGNYACGDGNAAMVYRDSNADIFRSMSVCSINVVKPITFYQDSREFKLQFSGQLNFENTAELIIEEGRAQGIETASTPRIAKGDVLIE